MVAGRPTIDKDPGAVLDYTIDFTDWLSGVKDTLLSVTHESSGVTVVSSEVSSDKRKVVVWVSGGAVDTAASVTVRIVTAAVRPRTDERSVYFRIKQR